ncbi:MAG TPA: type II toxin-antitoxin system RatA family toxin [Rhodanobacteraceae bacterium]|nr:type II toxin-antitoxin system RatA family toxin [Rhodanobacteraceae bacterium]
MQIHRQALVRFTPEQMFDLVNDVEAYPSRFAWCLGAQVSERDEGHVVARLDLRFAGVTQHFTTHNVLDRPSTIAMQFVDGPFDWLHGVWSFKPLGSDGCKVALDLDFEVSNKLTGFAFGLGFRKLADRMVDDFCAEAKRAYA